MSDETPKKYRDREERGYVPSKPPKPRDSFPSRPEPRTGIVPPSPPKPRPKPQPKDKNEG